ncbi:MAG: N-formylglutamate amidohydrolase [Rhizobiales bacterium]|nr:N-formylglutamate amidohydrolase [Hyphomicrobiales bacterium]
MTTEFGSPIEILRPVRRSVPLILSSPHSGQIYPSCLLQMTRLHLNQLRRLEDAFVDRLFDTAPLIGAPLLRARFARAFIDPNREAAELDAELLDERFRPTPTAIRPRPGPGSAPSRAASPASRSTAAD